MQKGIFTISLDFELFWGVRDHRTLENYGDNILKVNEIVPRLLSLFQNYGVHCTWATVGFLFAKNKDDLVNYFPESFPDYVKKEYDPYEYIRKNELASEFHFAPELIELIKKTPGQEIGTHTFSHFYTLEKNTTIQQFRDDLKAAIGLASKKGFKISSIIFPRNQYSEEHIEICKDLGITVFRGNEESKAYKPLSREDENQFRRAVRLVDSYFNVTGYQCHDLPEADDIINIPASRFLRPYDPKMKLLDGKKFLRIKNSMKYAANKGKVFHLWWHPHNFGQHTDKNFQFLEKILKIYQQLNLELKMESLNLSEIFTRTSKIVYED